MQPRQQVRGLHGGGKVARGKMRHRLEAGDAQGDGLAEHFLRRARGDRAQENRGAGRGGALQRDDVGRFRARGLERIAAQERCDIVHGAAQSRTQHRRAPADLLPLDAHLAPAALDAALPVPFDQVSSVPIGAQARPLHHELSELRAQRRKHRVSQVETAPRSRPLREKETRAPLPAALGKRCPLAVAGTLGCRCHDAQQPDGAIPSVVPDATDVAKDGGPAWADAVIICPWTIYQCYGDTRILESSYPAMVRFMDFLLGSSPGFIRCAPDFEGWPGYGDWLSINAATPRDLIGTAFLAYDARLMSEIAAALGEFLKS